MSRTGQTLTRILYTVEEIVSRAVRLVMPINGVGTPLDIQTALKAWGFDPGTINGESTPDTDAAVRAFQHELGILPTGIVDLWLWNIMSKLPPFDPNQLKGLDRPQYVKRVLQGLGWAECQAAAIVGQSMQESFSILKSDVWGDKGTAFGINQWRGDRLENLKQFAVVLNKPIGDLEVQARFIDWELRNNEKSVGEALARTNTLDDALKVAIAYERPRGYTPENPQNGDGWANRAKYARSLIA